MPLLREDAPVFSFHKGLTTANSLVSRTFIVLDYRVCLTPASLDVRGCRRTRRAGKRTSRVRDRSVTPLDLVGLTFECFVDSTASRRQKNG